MTRTPTYLNTYDNAQEYQSDFKDAENEFFRASYAFHALPNALNFVRLEQAMINHQHLRLNAREESTGMKAFRNLAA